MNSKKLISIDPSTKEPGWAKWVGSKLVKCGLGNDSLIDSAYIVGDVVIEGQVINRLSNPKSILNLAHAAGVTVGMLGKTAKEVKWTSPSWKRLWPKPKPLRIAAYTLEAAVLNALDEDELTIYKAACGKHKAQVRRFDLCDAVGLGLHHLGRI